MNHLHPYAFRLYPFDVTPFPCIRLRLIRLASITSYKNCLPRVRVGKTKLDGYTEPAFDRPFAVARRMKTPALDRFDGGAIERITARAVVDLHLFYPALIVDQGAQKHSTFTTLAAGAFRISWSRRIAITRLGERDTLCG